MKLPAKLLALPVLFAAGIAVGYWNGFLWPVAVTVHRILVPQPVTAETEPDYPA